ncbi:hypothetical protein F2P79_011066 [Pimephales promelas]|nr:hypothetical protein F2P79_011066 [Pimephales promelas]
MERGVSSMVPPTLRYHWMETAKVEEELLSINGIPEGNYLAFGVCCGWDSDPAVLPYRSLLMMMLSSPKLHA